MLKIWTYCFSPMSEAFHAASCTAASLFLWAKLLITLLWTKRFICEEISVLNGPVRQASSRSHRGQLRCHALHQLCRCPLPREIPTQALWKGRGTAFQKTPQLEKQQIICSSNYKDAPIWKFWADSGTAWPTIECLCGKETLRNHLYEKWTVTETIRVVVLRNTQWTSQQGQ